MNKIIALICSAVVAMPLAGLVGAELAGGAGVSAAAAGPIPNGRPAPRPVTAATMRRIHDSSMRRFLDYRRQRWGASSLDWSTDGCSWAPDTGPHFDFRAACWRHDFGYRNFKRYRIFNEGTRKLIDDKFLADMRAHCRTRNRFIRGACNQTARAYHEAVRRFGA